MEHNKAPGSDGFLIEFYQNFWKTIKGDLILMFGPHKGDLTLFNLNLVLSRPHGGSNLNFSETPLEAQDSHESLPGLRPEPLIHHLHDRIFKLAYRFSKSSL